MARRAPWLLLVVLVGCGRDQLGADDPAAEVGSPSVDPSLPDRAHFAFRAEGAVLRGAHSTYRSELHGGVLRFEPRSEDTVGTALELETRSLGRGGAGAELGSEAARIDADGHAVLGRGAAREELENRDDGVEQRWHFDARPEGEGPLRVEIDVSGLPYLETTEGGLHFGDGGLGVRYSHATFVDAAGVRTHVPVRWEGGIVVEVPAAVIDGAAYPAVLDPTIGPEIAIDAPVVGGNYSTSAVDVACTGTQCLAVWIDSRGGAAGAYAARISAAGVVLDPLGIALPLPAAGTPIPRVAALGTQFLVAWLTGTSGVFGIRIDATGAILDATPITIATSSISAAPRIAGSGSAWLVVFPQNATTTGLVAVRVSSGGGVLDASPVSVTDSFAYGSGDWDVVHDGSNGWMITYTGTRATGSAVLATRVSSGGTDLDAVDLVVDDPAGFVDAAAVGIARIGTTCLVVMRDPNLPNNTYGRRISTAGVVLDAARFVVRAGIAPSGVAADGTRFWVQHDRSGTRVSTAGAVIDAAAIQVNSASSSGVGFVADAVGSTFMVGWSEGLAAAPRGTWANRIDGATGARPSGDGFLVSRGANTEREVAISSSGAGSYLVWSDDRASGPGIYGVRLDAAGAPIGAPIAISTASRADQPSIAWNGTSWLAVWRDQRAGGMRYDVYGARISAAGVVLDPAGIPIAIGSPAWEQEPAVASNGTDWFVVWHDGRGGGSFVYGSRVSGAGVVLDGTGVAISTGEGRSPAIAFDGTEYLVAWGGTPIRARRISAAGAVLGSETVIETVASGVMSSTADVAGLPGGGFGVVWRENGASTRGIAANVVGALGAFDTSDITVASPSGIENLYRPAIAWTGSTFLVAYDRDGTDTAVLGVRMTAAGDPADTAPFEISRLAGHEQLAALTSPGGDIAFVAYHRPAPVDRAFVRRIVVGAANGAACSAADTCASNFCVDGRCCDSACGGGAVDCQACAVAAGGTTNGRCTALSAAAAPTTTCRASAGGCDVAETCTAGSTACPADALGAAGSVCRAASGACDVAELCDGSTAACPTDAVLASGTACRVAGGLCDVAEACDGASAACPSDVLAPVGTICRAAAGTCDVAEACTGTAAACPADTLRSVGTSCRAAAGACDVAESCDGASGACPADGVRAAGTSCRVAAGTCDLGESCDGTAPACPADARRPSGTECRASAGACDVAESCDGAAIDCPTDALAGVGTECRASAGACDVAESCDGAAVDCPADALAPASSECRASSGACDVAEACTGSSSGCPADVLVAAGLECRASAGTCDPAELCSGSAGACPTDARAASGTECRPSAAACDVAESCDGAATACPLDASAADGATCDDGDPCTGAGACAAGACVPGPVDCDDGDPCTADSCAVSGGCRHDPVPGCADAGTTEDAGATEDAGITEDAGATEEDAGVTEDAGSTADAASALDASVPDASAPDASRRDAGASTDATTIDASAPAPTSGGCSCRAGSAPESAGLAWVVPILVLARRWTRRCARASAT